jgi:hypothetical protein
LGKIGLLGEYTPPLRKKGRPLSDKVSCMHLGPCKGYPEFSGCSSRISRRHRNCCLS